MTILSPRSLNRAQTKMAGGAAEYLVCFSEKCEKEDLKQHIIDCLTLAKFSVTQEEFEGKTLLTVGAPFEILAQKVSYLQLSRVRTICLGISLYVSSLLLFTNGCETILTNDFLGGGSRFGENHKD